MVDAYTTDIYIIYLEIHLALSHVSLRALYFCDFCMHLKVYYHTSD